MGTEKEIIFLNKFICWALSMIMFISAFNVNLENVYADSLDDALNKVNLYEVGDRGASLLAFNDRPIGATIIAYTDERTGKELSAYCCNPDKNGVEECGSYDVDIDIADSNPQIWGAITNGHPYKTPEELGVTTEYEAYYITKMAVWVLAYTPYSDLSNWTAVDSRYDYVLEAMKNLVGVGRATDTIEETWITFTPVSPSSDSLVQEFELNSNVFISSFSIGFGSDAPSGIIVSDSDTGATPDVFGSSTSKITITIPDTVETSGSFDMTAKVVLENKSVLYGMSHDPDKQNYYVAPTPLVLDHLPLNVSYGVTPPPPDPESVGMSIFKYEDGTRIGLEGAVFKITGALTGNIGSYATDENGQITIEDLAEDTYTIEEIVAPSGYVLSDVNYQNIVLSADSGDTAIEVTFENKEESKLEIMKVDADTNDVLANAVFRIALEGGADFVDIVTDASGMAYLTGMKEGIYTVTEIVAPSGYILNSEAEIVKLEAGKTTSITMKNYGGTKIIVKKYDEATTLPLPNAEFSVAKKGGSIVYEGITDASGQMIVEDLDEGWYTVTEIAPPYGYIITTESKDVYLEQGKTVEIKFDNRRKPSLQIMKIDSVTNEPLMGAKFKVTKTEDSTVSEFITDSSGTILIENLDEAIYTVEEITAPTGYVLSSEPQNIKLEWGKTKTLIFENTKKPTLIITKTDAITMKGIPNTTFKIEYETSNGGVVTVGTYRTDSNGQIVLENMNPGWYIITETLPAQGYQLSSNPVTRKYLAEGENAYTINDDIVEPPTVEPLTPSIDDMTANENEVVNEEDAIATLDEVVDVSNSTASAVSNVVITSGADYGVDVPNYPLNSIVIKKSDAITKEMLQGATFEVIKTSGETSGTNGTVICTVTTDISGVIVVTGLEAGTYAIKEISPPTNYLIGETNLQTVTLKADGTSIVEVLFNNYPYGSLLISKVNSKTREPLADVKFKVTNGDGQAVSTSDGIFYTNNVGQILIPNLKPDSYVVTEIETLPNYVLDSTPQTIQVGTDGATYNVYFDNDPYGSLLIKKIDSISKEPLQNAKFKVVNSNGNVVGNSNGEYTTDVNGEILISNIPPDAYVVTEIQSPDNYVLDSTPKTINVNADGEVYAVEFTNNPYSSLLINKVDGTTRESLQFARFTVADSKGTTIGTYTTNVDGQIVVSNLEPGTYIITEIEAPPNYVLDYTPQVVEIGADGGVYEVEFINYPYSNLTIKKTDGTTKQPLSNAEFKVTKADESVVGTYKTDLDGLITIPNLIPGTYVITETKAPDNYILDTVSKTIEIGADGGVYEVEFVNYPYSTLVINKIDAKTKEPLADAKFKVETENNFVLGTYTTDVNGQIILDNIEPSTYIITEIVAPNNYVLNGIPEFVDIKANGEVYNVEFANYPCASLLVQKVDGTTNEPLANAKFKITNSNGTVVGNENGEYTTDVNGEILIPNLSPDSYIITELQAPENYVLNDTPQTIEIGADGEIYKVTFANYPHSTLVINKIDAKTKEPLADAKFKVETENNFVLGTYTTDVNGQIILDNIEPSTYIITEIVAPNNYVLNGIPEFVDIKANGEVYNVEFANYPCASLLVQKVDGTTNEPLANAKFKITNSNGTVVGNENGEYTTDVNGEILIPNLSPDSYIITELQAPENYVLNDTPQTIEIGADGEIYKVTFANYPYASLLVQKVDGTTNEPLANAKFKITNSNGTVVGNENGEYITDVNGEILIPNLSPDSYIITELQAPENYVLDDTPQTVKIEADKEVYKVTFANYPYSNLLITKVDAKTNEPLANAVFSVVTGDGEVVGNSNGKYTTDNDGSILISNLKPNSYVVTEVQAPENYYIDDTPQTIEIDRTGETYKVSFANEPYSTIVILKKDEDSKEPLANARFKVTSSDGTVVGDNNGIYTTDLNGSIIIPYLAKDSYIIEETDAPDGYFLEQNTTTIATEYGKTHTVEITNKKLTSLVIKKVDDVTGEPLVGADFFVEKQNGEHIGEYTTDATGTILIPQLDPDYYLIRETKAPAGYILDESPKTVEVKINVPTVVTFTNKALSGIKIIKTDSETGELLQGVKFSVMKMNGEKIGDFETDKYGMIYVSNLEDGYYQAIETQGLDGYHFSQEPYTVLVESGKQTILEVENQPYSMLIIEKTCAVSGDYLEGVEFLVTKQNGERIDYYTTDASGRIVIEGLADGIYTVTETKEAKGYLLDTTAHDVEIKNGQSYTLKIENEPLGSVIIRKIDSITKSGIYGVKFILYDSNNAPIGEYTSDSDGYIWIDSELPDGKYSLREIQPADGYIGDEIPKTFYIQEGKTTNIVWENTPKTGQIVITKRSADFNHLTGLAEGSPLSGASFEIYNLTGNLVDKMVSNESGIASSQLLPIGVYIVKEVSAPTYYALDGKELIAEIRSNGDIVRFEVLNKSLDLNLTIRKKSQNSVASGQTLQYDIYDVENLSTAPLTNFYIHDRIPTDATRVTKVVTGTYSERMYYKLTYKTNLSADYIVLAENLLTKNSYEYSLTSEVLNLQNGEYVTDVRLEFPQVSSGFKMEESMSVFCYVLPSLPKDYQIVNRADCGGVFHNQWESATTSWTTTIWKLDTPTTPLPQTGY